jgi:hypothetical protein
MSDSDTVLLSKINAAVAAANEAEKNVKTAQTEFVSRSKAVGLLLLDAKKLHPKVEDFKAFLKKVHGLELSRAYDLLRIAGGRKTDEELRKETRERVKKHRASKKLPRPASAPKPSKLSVTSGDVTESPEISIEQRRAEHADLDLGAEEKAAKWSASNLREFEHACKTYLPLLNEADLKTARAFVTLDQWRAKKAA